jgi:hypothetical protein
MPAYARATTLARDNRAIVIENELVLVSVLIDKGADIYEAIHKPTGVDVLWKSPWGLRRPGSIDIASNSVVAWLENYSGGWQELFPSGGGPCTSKGVELNFHGEASMVAWDVDIVASGGDVAEVLFSTRLFRSPFRIERRMRLQAGSGSVEIEGRIVNEGGEAMDYMWSHHPAFGGAFLGDDVRIDTNAVAVIADDQYDGVGNPLAPDSRHTWPRVSRDGAAADLSVVPAVGEKRSILAYLADWGGDHGWYALTNRQQRVGVGLVWPVADFPYAWFWQELHASPGYPWYAGVRVMAIEPATSIPGQGLVTVMAKSGLHRTLGPGEEARNRLVMTLFDDAGEVTAIAPDGRVTRR